MAMTQDDLHGIFTTMQSRFQPQKAQGVNATIQLDLSGIPSGQYWLRIQDGALESGEGQTSNPNMTLRADAEDYAAIMSGQMNVMQAFMSGKLKVQGDMGLALKLQPMFGL